MKWRNLLKQYANLTPKACLAEGEPNTVQTLRNPFQSIKQYNLCCLHSKQVLVFSKVYIYVSVVDGTINVTFVHMCDTF